MAARDQFQGQLALADAGITGNQQANTENFHENTMQGDFFGKQVGQVVLQVVYQLDVGLGGAQQWC